MDRNDVWTFPFYIMDFLILAAILFCFIHFLRKRHFLLVPTSHSNIDYGLLIILSLFCLLPVVHFVKMSPRKCENFWLMQNVVFAVYCGLLFTKLGFFSQTGREVACKQALLQKEEQHSGIQAIVCSALFVVLPVVIILFTIAFAPHKVQYFSCPSREFLRFCPIKEEKSVLASMAYTWGLLLSLSVLALAGNYKAKKSWKIPWLIFIALLSYTALIFCSNMELQCIHESWFDCILYLFILINPTISLTFLYLPNLHLITTCSLHLKSFQKAFRSMRSRSGRLHRQISSIEVIADHRLHASHHGGLQAEYRVSFNDNTRPVSYASDLSSRILNIQKSIQIISNLFKDREPGYQLLRQPSFYDNISQRGITWSNDSQLSFTESQASGEENSLLELETEITCKELKEMTEFLKGLKHSDV